MGITIHHTIGIQKGRVIKALDRTESIARDIEINQARPLGIPFELRRISPTALYIDIGNCETLAFDFKTYGELLSEHAYIKDCFEHYFAPRLLNASPATDEHLASWPDQQLLWSFNSCKTQFAKHLVEHRWIAELIRSLASIADLSYIHDEGDYYHSLDIDSAANRIAFLGEMINGIGQMLGQGGFTVKAGGSTKITKPRSKKK